MDENTRRLAQFLLSEKDTRPHWETDQRAMLMPLVMSGYNNSVGYGVPSFLGGHAWSTMGDIVKGNAVHPDEIAHSANDAAGAAMLGSMPMGATRRGASLGSGGGNTKAPDRSLAPSLQGQSNGASRVLAETDKYDRFLQRVQDRFDEYGVHDNGPVIGPRTPGIDDGAVMAAAKAGFNLVDRDLGFGKTAADGGVPEVGSNASVAHIASALWDAAKASGRKLEIAGDPKYPYMSAYGFLETPAGGRYKVRIADHANTSSRHDPPDFNIAPGEMTPSEFIALLPKIYSNPRTSAAAPLALEAMKDKGGSGVRAYHGSPHDFDRFDISKIGTGEGAQAFGHGLYFAENEAVAKSYRNNLTADRAWKDTAIRDAEPKLAQALVDRGYPKDLAASVAQTVRLEHVMNTPETSLARLYGNRGGEFNRALADAWKLRNDILGGSPGHMYEVNIKADPNDFLDWDKPLKQQSEKVRQAFSDAVVPNRGREDDVLMRELFGVDAGHAGLGLFDGSKGSQAYNTFAGDGGHVAAAKALSDAGIPGIRYLDQGSRAAGEGSHNYVVFDDKLIEILRKYGLAGILAGGYAMTGQEPQE